MSGETTLQEVLQRIERISAENAQLTQRLTDGEFRFRQLAKSVWQVQEEERRGLALELHDGVGQILTALINHLQHTAGDADDGNNHEAVELASSALAEIRRLSRALRPSVLDDLGLEAALRWLTRTTAETSGLAIELIWPDDGVALDKESETLVFRIMQEAVTNIVRHADATRARIVARHADGRFEVSVADNGCGFDAAATLAASDQGFGTRGMRDRADLFGGHLNIESAPGDGTTVTLELPEAGV